MLTGGAGNDTLDGGAGADTMVGGAGNDTYIVDNAGDVVIESASAKAPTRCRASVSYTLGANVENLTLTGAPTSTAPATALANVITGNSGNNTLDGGAGADTMIGGAGNDTYVVDNAGDVVTEARNAGTDTVQSSVSYTLGANVENLTLTGSATSTAPATRRQRHHRQQRQRHARRRRRRRHHDRRHRQRHLHRRQRRRRGDGSAQRRHRHGAVVGQLHARRQCREPDPDRHRQLNGTGNDHCNNVITGNSGNNMLDGGAGADTMTAAGNDTYVVDNAGDVVTEALNEGTDTVQSSVSYALGANVENLTLTGSGNINATGNAIANVITGNAGNNVLTGGGGNDTLVGGAGTDTAAYTATITAASVTSDGAGHFVVAAGGSEGTDTLSGIEKIDGAGTANILLVGNGGYATIQAAIAAATPATPSWSPPGPITRTWSSIRA